MSGAGRTILGILTFWPLLYFVLFFLMIAGTAVMIPLSTDGGPPLMFTIVFPLHFFTIVEMLGLTVYYGVHVYREPLLQGDRKILWMVIVLLGGMIGQAIYYVLWIVKRNPSVLGTSLERLRPASWEPDPVGGHELRYWDGARWTSFVSDEGKIQEDPVCGESPPGGTSDQQT